MAKTKITWRTKGFEEIRRSPEAISMIQAKVDSALAACGGEAAGYRGFVAADAPGTTTRGRAIGTVTTWEFKGVRDNAKNKTLLRAFDRFGD